MLLKTNKLLILQKLFKKIVIPKAVYLEITAKEQEKLIFDNLDWIEVRESKELKSTVFLRNSSIRGS